MTGQEAQGGVLVGCRAHARAPDVSVAGWIGREGPALRRRDGLWYGGLQLD